MPIKSYFFDALLKKLNTSTDYSDLFLSYNKLSHDKAWLKTALIYFKKEFFFIILLGILVSASALLINLISSYFFSHFYEINQTRHFLLFISFFFFLLSSSLLSYINDITIKSFNIKFLFRLLPRLWEHFLNLPLKIVHKFTSGDLAQRLLDYEAALLSIMTMTFSLLFGAITLLFLLGYMAYYNLSLAFIFLGIGVFFTILKILFLPHYINHTTAQLEEQGKLSSLLNEALLQIHKIRSAHIEEKIHLRWLHNLINLKQRAEKSEKIEIILIAFESLMPLILLLSLYTRIYFAPPDQGLYFLPFIICTGQLSGVFTRLSSEIMILVRVLPALKRIQLLLDEEPEKNLSLPYSLEFKGEITFSHIYFKNPETGKLILEDISIHIPAGKFIALLGPSGAGKSTLMKILLGFESADSGTILLDQENSKNIDRKKILKQFGVVLQTTHLLPGTLFSNIASNSGILLEEAWQLASYVGLEEDILQMPMKMHTYVSDNAGESLSGGQKQKILIARALASHPKVLLLDEATSALDNKSQAIIYKNLKTLNITRFVIAHRYSTIVDADRIYVIDKGKIMAQGKYEQISHLLL